MRLKNTSIIIAGSLLFLQAIKADSERGVVASNDTIKTYSIGEVIVTSTTKETNDLRSLPASVSIFSPRSIASRQIETIKDISSTVPNLYMPDYGAKLTSAIYIRGIGARSSGQSIGLYMDNVPYLDKSTFDFEMMDIQRIEVLRGPQGTLYGRNAMGGIINIYTLSPFDYQGTKVTLSSGNYGLFNAKASLYGKINDKLAFSIGQYYERSDGFFVNEYTGKRADNGESAGGRFKLEWRPNRNFSASYTANFDFSDQRAFPYGFYDKETGETDPVNYNDPSRYVRRVLSNSLLMQYRTDKVLFTSTTGYQYFKDNMDMDQDFTPKSVFILNQRQKQHAGSQEFTLKSNTKSNYQWSYGLYGFYDGLNTEGPVTFKKDGIGIFQKVFDNLKESAPKMPQLTITNESLYIPGTFDTPTYGGALFHQSTYNNLFVEGLSLTAGVRLDYEYQRIRYQSNPDKMALSMSMKPGMPPMDVSKYYPETAIDEKTSHDFWQFVPKVSLRYQCTPSTFTYLTVAKGYKAGGYNIQQSADMAQSQMTYDMMKGFHDKGIPISIPQEPESLENTAAYKPESSWNYEAGIRSELIKGYLNSELTLFYMDIRDVQITKFVASGSGRILANAGKARSCGVELTLRGRISPEITADMNYGYTHASFRNYDNGKTDFKGKFIPYTPRHTLSLNAQYIKNLRGCYFDQFSASAQFNGAGKIYWTEYNDIAQNFYGTVNAKVGVRKNHVSLNVWSRNLTSTNYDVFYFESMGNPFIQKGKPFQIGIELALTL